MYESVIPIIFRRHGSVMEKQIKPELLKQRPDWPELKAIKDNQVLVMEESLDIVGRLHVFYLGFKN